MEDRGFVITASLTLAVSITFFAPALVQAYAVETHGVITQAIIEAYEQRYGDVFTPLQERAMVQGSKDEDDALRFLNHFNDGVTGEGILSYQASGVWVNDIIKQANWGLKKIRGGGLKANDPLFSASQDYTWERAVYEYAQVDTERGIETLGHVLHLIEDATVPAHVRNDMHPYRWGIGDRDEHEEFYKDFTSDDIVISEIDTVWFGSIAEALAHTAQFTQEHFLSSDTLFESYSKPRRESVELERARTDGKNQYFGVGSFGKIVRVYRNRDTDRDSATADSVIEEYFLTDKENKVLTENWEVLSQHAVASGVGVIELFFREVAKEKETGRLLAMNKSRNETKRVINALADVRDFKIRLTSLAAADVYELNKDSLDGYFDAADVYGIHVPAVARNSALEEAETEVHRQPAAALLAFEQVSVLGTPIPEGMPDIIAIPATDEVPALDENEELTEIAPEPSTETILEEEAVLFGEEGNDSTQSQPSPFEPGGYAYGGGGGGSASTSNVTASNPDVPTVNSPVSGEAVATTSVSFIGDGTAGNTLTVEMGTTTATTTIATDGSWSIDGLIFTEGSTTAEVYQVDGDGNTSDKLSVEVVVDITVPSTTVIEVLECTDSLRVDGECLSGKEEVQVEWSAIDDAHSYSVFIDGTEVATTTATSTTVTLIDQNTSDISVVVYDVAGNSSAQSNAVTVSIFVNPIVFAEIAWAGTDADDEHEWIELYNRSGKELSLENISIQSVDGSVAIALSGSIGTGSHWSQKSYVLERGTDDVMNRTAELVVDWDALDDAGEELMLVYDNGIFSYEIERTPTITDCSGWCGGAKSTHHYSMERIDVDVSGDSTDNWQSNDGYAVINEYYDDRGYALDHKIYGTVAQENSKGYPPFGYFCEPYTDAFVDGQVYTPDVGGNCTYLLALWDSGDSSVDASGGIYAGTIGSSTSISGSQMGSIFSTQNGNIPASLSAGPVFVAVWEQKKSGEDNAFVDYFIGTSTTTPHDNFEVLNWVYE